MVMPSSGPISMAQAHAEFGLGYNLNAYYGCDSGVPTSGAISLGHLYGKRKRPAFNNYCLVMNTQSFAAGYFYPAEIEFREIENSTKFPVTPWYGTTGGSMSPWFDGSTATASSTTGTNDQYVAVSANGGAKVLRQVAMFVPGGFPGPRDVKIYGSNGGITAPNPPSMSGWTLLHTSSRPTQVWNGWATYEI